MRKAALIGLTVLVMGLAAREASAVWVQSQIGPKFTRNDTRDFKITATRKEGFVQYELVVTGRKKRISPFADGCLRLIDGDKTVGELPIRERWEGDKVKFWFRVSPTAIAQSRFDFNEQGWFERNDDRPAGLPTDPTGKYEMTLGGHAYFFYLRDFAPGP
jgi:hypothetical protein